MLEIKKIANEARTSISEYCMDECKSYCCRKGYLSLKPSQVALVTQNRAKELEDKQLLIQSGDEFVLFIGDKEVSCPSLKDGKCMIHKDKNRPQMCADFPLFITDKNVRLSGRCPAVRECKFYPFLRRITALGYKYQFNIKH